jgi:hypothetical protein
MRDDYNNPAESPPIKPKPHTLPDVMGNEQDIRSAALIALFYSQLNCIQHAKYRSIAVRRTAIDQIILLYLPCYTMS